MHIYVDVLFRTHFFQTRLNMTIEPQTKKQKVSLESPSSDSADNSAPVSAQETSGWVPKSLSSIDNMFLFDTSTYHSPIPRLVAENGKESVVLGVDEAGRGPVLGAMVYGISYCLESYHDQLKKKYGFADSKTLKDSKRQELFQLIDNEADELYDNVGWATCTMTAKDISSGMLRSGVGAYNLNEQAHDTTIKLIREVLDAGVNLEKIFVDTVGPPASYQAKLKGFFPGIDITVAKKADSIYPIVSTASVVAKVTRDLNLEWYNREMYDGQRLGSGYPSDPNTSAWLNGNVDKVFGWSHGLIRFSWQTAKDSLEKKGGAPVIYEAQCVKDGGYGDVGALFAERKSGLVDLLFYGRAVEL